MAPAKMVIAGNWKMFKGLAETRAFAPLMLSDTSRNLRRVFKLSEMMKAQAPKNLAFKPLRVPSHRGHVCS